MVTDRCETHRGSFFPRLWDSMKKQIVEEVPEEIALCEFNCRKNQCTQAEWATCPRRLEFEALRRRSAARQAVSAGVGPCRLTKI